MVLHQQSMEDTILRLPNSLSKETTGGKGYWTAGFGGSRLSKTTTVEMGIGLKVLGEVVSGSLFDPIPNG